MAFGTPTDGGAAYSSNNGTTVSPAYPSGIQANDVVVLVIGQKPSTANGGTVTTPNGWTLRESITGQGGYGTTLGADEGNTNLFIYTKDVVAGNETGNLSVTVGTNNVCWGLIIRIPGGGATSESFGSADGGRTTAPTSGAAFTNTLTNGTSAPDIQSGDMVIFAMCIPTDVLNNGFTAPTISSSGTTFGTAVELEEPDSGTGNDIGGYVAYASATSGSSTAAPTIGATATGTVTNVRGPLILLRIRNTTQSLTPNLYTNTNTFYTPTVTKGAATIAPNRYDNTNTFYTQTLTKRNTLTPALYTNTNTFYTPTVEQGSATKNLSPDLYTNTNTFYTQTLTKRNTLTPALYTNTNVFYSATVGRGAVNLQPALYTNTNVFYSPTVTKGAVNLQPARYNNTNVFYSATITQTGANQTLTPSLYANTNSFYAASVTTLRVLTPALYMNANSFYSATVTGQNTLAPELLTNDNTFYSAEIVQNQLIYPSLFTNQNEVYDPVVTTGTAVIAPDLYVNANSFYSVDVIPGTITLAPDLYDNTNSFYFADITTAATLLPDLYDNSNSFYLAVLSTNFTVAPNRYNNQNEFYSPRVARSQQLLPARYNNTNSFYSLTVTTAKTLAPQRLNNANRFFTPRVRSQVTLTPARLNNTNTFYTATLGYKLTMPNYVAFGYVRPDYIGLPVQNVQTWYTQALVYPQTVEPPLVVNQNQFFTANVSRIISPALFVNTNTFFSARVARIQRLFPELYQSPTVFPPCDIGPAAPGPRWNPTSIATADNFDGVPGAVPNDWTAGENPPVPSFTPDNAVALPDWQRTT